jgi:membrane protein YqaA with SNARE-associated domain
MNKIENMNKEEAGDKREGEVSKKQLENEMEMKETEKEQQRKQKLEAKQKSEKRENRKKIGFNRLFKYATAFDWFLLFIGTLAAMAGIFKIYFDPFVSTI